MSTHLNQVSVDQWLLLLIENRTLATLLLSTVTRKRLESPLQIATTNSKLEFLRKAKCVLALLKTLNMTASLLYSYLDVSLEITKEVAVLTAIT